jgi:hypothetical protein
MIKLIFSLLVLPLSVLSGILYRMGGAAGWNTKYRDVGCSLLFYGTLLAYLFFSEVSLNIWGYLACLLSFGFLWASLSTYWDNVFGFDNLWVHGFMCGFSSLPYAIYTGKYIPLIIASLALAILIGGWNYIANKYLPGTVKILKWYVNKAVLEEFVRGLLLGLSILLYL